MRRVLVVLVLASLLVMVLSVPVLANKVDPADGPPNAWGQLYKAYNVDPYKPMPMGQAIKYLVKPSLPGDGYTWSQINSEKIFPPPN